MGRFPHRVGGSVFLVASVTAIAFMGCSGDTGGISHKTLSPSLETESSTLSNIDRYTQRNEENGLTTILATTDIGVGENRFAFVLTELEVIVKFPVITVKTFHYPNGYEDIREGPVEQKFATFREFPFGTRGVYSVEYKFDRPGKWGAEVSFPSDTGISLTTEHLFNVRDSTLAPAVGESPPKSRNNTLADVDSVSQLTTGTLRDRELYDLSIPEALESGRPFTVVFASPAFCTTPVCGPQVEVISELNMKFGDRMDFIHVDLFINPHEIQGDADLAIRTPLLKAWKIFTDEWTFVINESGKVTGRFEGFASYSEIEETIVATLREG